MTEAPIEPRIETKTGGGTARALGLVAGVLAVLSLGGIYLIVLAMLLVSRSGGGTMASRWGKESVAIVRVEDAIYDARPILRYLDRYAERDDVKAVVLRIETPGGSVAACQEIARRVAEIRAGADGNDPKPVVSQIANIGASGGYYIASATDGIQSESGSLVGSIGVIYFSPNFEELLKKVGVSFQVVSSGPLKEAGGWYRSMRPEEREEIEGIILNAYAQFFADVMAGRADALRMATGEKDAAVALRRVADGRILTGEMALSAGLVDRIGSLPDAIAWAADLAGIEGEPEVVEEDLENTLEAKLERVLGNAFARPLGLDLVGRIPFGLYFLSPR